MKKISNYFKIFCIFMFLLSISVFVFACDKPKKTMVTITFETYDGPTVNEIEVEAGSSVTLVNPTEWEHHFFEGWYKTENFASDVALDNNFVAPEENITLYAKWTSEYQVKFDLNGGTIPNGDDIWLKEGAGVLDALKDIVPEKDGVTFDKWLLNGNELTSNDKINGEITLQARWTVEYKIELYIQDVEKNDSYTLYDTLNKTDYVGNTVTYNEDNISGFHLVNKNETVDTLVLTDKKDDNVLRLYYDRNEYILTYNANLPEGVEYTGEVTSDNNIYQKQLIVKDSNYTLQTKGYLFAGWSTSSDGEVEYAPNDTIELTDNIILYAVWDVAYKDAWGGKDLIYILQNEKGKVLLDRFDEIFEGTIDDNGVFTIVGMTGKVYDDYFAYYRQDFAETFSYLDGYYHPNGNDEIIDKNTTLKLDGYLEGVYTYKQQNDTITQKGFYGYDSENQSYYFQFDDGTRKDFRIGTYQETAVFAFKGNEAGLYDEFEPTSTIGGILGQYTILLDGYGSVMLGDTSTQDVYEGTYYIEQSDFYYGDDAVQYYFVYTEIGTFQFYNYPLIDDVLVLKAEEKTYTGTLNNLPTTLTLSGSGLLLGAEIGDETYNYYIIDSNVFGKLLHLYDETYKEVMTILLSDENNTFVLFDENFVEYIYLRIDENGQPNLYYPIVLIYDETSKNGKRAEIYNIDDTGTLYHAATCDYSDNATLYGYAYYTLTLKEMHTENKAIFPVSEDDFNSASIIFTQGTLIVDVYYILEYNGEALYKTYSEKNNGNGRLWVGVDTGISGLGSFYIANGEYLEGRILKTYTNIQAFGMTAVQFIYRENGALNNIYFALYDDDTYRIMEYEPYQAQLLDEYGTQKQQAGIYFDGLGNGYYFASGNDFYDNIYLSGTVVKTDQTTMNGKEIWEIRSSVGSLLTFVLEQYTSVTYLCYPYYERSIELVGTNENELLVLDGYNYMGQYTDSNGNVSMGEYHLLNPSDCAIPAEYEKAYVMQLSGGLFYRFYVKEDGSFDTILSVLGNMDEGMIMIMDDSYNTLGAIMVSFSDMEVQIIFISFQSESLMGMGSEFTLVSNEDRAIVSAPFLFMDEATEEMWEETYILSDFEDSSCVVFNQSIAGTYQDNAGKLTIDGYGYAQYIDRYGFDSEGAYVIFTGSNYIAYESQNGSGSIVIQLDTETEKFVEINLKPYYATYKADDGSEISFAEYFFVDDEAIGFWYVADDIVTFMVYDDMDSGCYILQTFDLNQDVITYNGKEYHLQ